VTLTWTNKLIPKPTHLIRYVRAWSSCLPNLYEFSTTWRWWVIVVSWSSTTTVPSITHIRPVRWLWRRREIYHISTWTVDPTGRWVPGCPIDWDERRWELAGITVGVAATAAVGRCMPLLCLRRTNHSWCVMWRMLRVKEGTCMRGWGKHLVVGRISKAHQVQGTLRHIWHIAQSSWRGVCTWRPAMKKYGPCECARSIHIITNLTTNCMSVIFKIYIFLRKCIEIVTCYNYYKNG